MRLPKTVGIWTMKAAPRTIAAANIFDYMDGAGELYLAYRFDHLEVFDYVSAAHGSLTVELYLMETSDDAFGLLSGDWGGEAVTLAETAGALPSVATVPPHRALYGAGLLRLWADRVYARVLASRETPESHRAVLDLGRAIAAGAASPAPPRLLAALPRDAGPGRALRSDRVWFLRSYLVLNSAYFLATEDILNLGRSVEVAVAPYAAGRLEQGASSAQLILVRYASDEDARRALARFREAYIPEVRRGRAALGLAETGVLRIEEGWLAYRVAGRALAVALECPTSEAGRALVEQAVRNLKSLEGSGDG